MHSLVVFPGVAMTCEGLGDAPKDFASSGFEEGGWDTRDRINLQELRPFGFRKSSHLSLPYFVDGLVGSLFDVRCRVCGL